MRIVILNCETATNPKKFPGSELPFYFSDSSELSLLVKGFYLFKILNNKESCFCIFTCAVFSTMMGVCMDVCVFERERDRSPIHVSGMLAAQQNFLLLSAFIFLKVLQKLRL